MERRGMPDKIRRKVAAGLHAFEREPTGPAAILLFWVSKLYGIGAKRRRRLYGMRILKPRHLPCPVISVGNLTAGGTGKTPMAAYLAARFKETGYRPAVLSRGYKGKAQKRGGVVTDGHSVFMSPETAGDEPCMLAQQLSGVPILVGSDRFSSGTRAIQRYRANVLILDDGFQHLALKRDLDLVLLDYQRPLGNGCLLPRGPLREPVSALSAADGFVLTRCDPASVSKKEIPAFMRGPAFEDKPIFYAVHVPVVHPAAEDALGEKGLCTVGRRRGVAFSGIAQNADFQRSLKAMDCDIADFSGFPDHHPYTKEELEAIWRKARRTGAFFVATTEKDYTRIRGRIPGDIPLLVVGIRLQLLGGAAAFFEWIRRRIEGVSHAP